MSFTRFHDDPNRILMHVEDSTYSGDYYLNMPGPGVNLPFFEEPQVRMQTWGANLRDNAINLESDLFGITRRLNRHEVDVHEYQKTSVHAPEKYYGSSQPFVEESRASHPAWMYKDLEHSRWEHPFLNPQNNIELKFPSNVQTRILEKDNFSPTIPVVSGTENDEYYLTGRSQCIMGNERECRGNTYI
jgi:hypothetical protein